MKKAVNIHRDNMPEWFQKSDFGIFIHWGPYSVPAYAPVSSESALEILRSKGPEYLFANQPYAEWYQNSMRIPDSPVAKYHDEHYKGMDYGMFAEVFRKSARNVNTENWADLFCKAGAKYVVVVTKHHDGFLMFNSSHRNPNRKDYQLDFDFVGDLAKACRKRGMRFGVYYSSLLDWTFTMKPIIHFSDMVMGNDSSRLYKDYCLNHWMELIDRYKPDILWSDIGYPADRRITNLFSYYYSQVPEGVVNDRWDQIPVLFRNRLVKNIIDKLASRTLSKGEERNMLSARFYDYRTLEYSTEFPETGYYFEMCRGMDKSFAYNRNSRPEDYVTAGEVRSIIADIHGKKGRLLLNVGPDQYGSIPGYQKNILEGLL
jgi:alpha-L-fucosidase